MLDWKKEESLKHLTHLPWFTRQFWDIFAVDKRLAVLNVQKRKDKKMARNKQNHSINKKYSFLTVEDVIFSIFLFHHLIYIFFCIHQIDWACRKKNASRLISFRWNRYKPCFVHFSPNRYHFESARNHVLRFHLRLIHHTNVAPKCLRIDTIRRYDFLVCWTKILAVIYFFHRTSLEKEIELIAIRNWNVQRFKNITDKNNMFKIWKHGNFHTNNILLLIMYL